MLNFFRPARLAELPRTAFIYFEKECLSIWTAFHFWLQHKKVGQPAAERKFRRTF